MGDEGQVPNDDPLLIAALALARADSVAEIEAAVTARPALATRAFLDGLDAAIDRAERSHGRDWWPLTRARVLLAGWMEHVVEDALQRCRTRDLLPLGPDGVRRSVRNHPELLDERTNARLAHWADEARAHGDTLRADQIELRRELLRELAAATVKTRADAAMADEQAFLRSGELAALDRALALRRWLAHAPDAPFVATEVRLAGRQAVCRLLQQRFHAAGDLSDLDAAISEAEAGLGALPERHLVHDALLGELGNALNVRFRALRSHADIDRAVGAFAALVDRPARPGCDPDDAVTAEVNLAAALLDRHAAFAGHDDLVRAVELLRGVLRATPPDSPRRALRLNNLGAALYSDFEKSGDRQRLREAIDVQREALRASDEVLRVHVLAALARSLAAAQALAGAETLGEAGADEARDLFREACERGLEINVSAAMWAGMTWARRGWRASDWAAAAEAYDYCARGARKLFGGQAREPDQEIRLAQFAEAAPRAAFALARHGRVADAAVAFELGRGQLLRRALEQGQAVGATPSPDFVPLASRARVGVAPVQRTVPDIDSIVAAAGTAPLLYLVVTDQGGVALLVRQGGVVAIDLPLLRTDAVGKAVDTFRSGLAATRESERAQAFDSVTAWLWQATLGPVLDQLGDAESILLVPGGLLGLLPLHAAWTPDKSQPSGRRHAIDVVAFSYAPSAHALAVARAAATAHESARGGPPLVVRDPRLAFAADEAKILAWHFPDAAVLDDERATRAEVGSGLAAARFAHFACHAFADLRKPTSGGLVLAHDEVLSVRNVRDLHVHARLAVLSACETGVAGLPLPDEVVSLPTGFLQAGVAGVVATLWRVNDRATAMLMGELYRQLCRERQPPAAALRAAQRWLRDTTNEEKRACWAAGVGDWLPADVAERLRDAVGQGDARAFSSLFWWGAFTHVGA